MARVMQSSLSLSAPQAKTPLLRGFHVKAQRFPSRLHFLHIHTPFKSSKNSINRKAIFGEEIRPVNFGISPKSLVFSTKRTLNLPRSLVEENADHDKSEDPTISSKTIIQEAPIDSSTNAEEKIKSTVKASESALKKMQLLKKENEILQARLSEMEKALAAAERINKNKINADIPSPVISQDEVTSKVSEAIATPEVLPPESIKIEDIEWPSPYDDPPFWNSPKITSPKITPSNSQEIPGLVKANKLKQDPSPLHIIHITAEMAPIAKVGGLGDVITGLSRACIARGHKVEVILPFYSCIDESSIKNLTLLRSFGSYFKGEWPAVQAYEGIVAEIPVIFLKPENHFFQGDRIYGGSYNEAEAYLFFSRASLEYLQVTKSQPDILHIHEWHTSAVALLYWDMYHYLSLKKPRLVLTIHNMEHYGECRSELLDLCGLDGLSYVSEDKAVDDRTIGHNPERLSLLKGGIVYCNAVTTVSPTYAQETLCSGWLSATLIKHRTKYFGLLNGIDTDLWNPHTDPHLPATFSDLELAGKAACKHFLQRGFGFDLEISPEDIVSASEIIGSNSYSKRVPLVVCVTRLVAQKGIHLIRHAIFRTKELGGQFILLGSSPDGRIQGEFDGLAKELNSSNNIRLLLTYNEGLSHLLFAAADIILVPSMFEPCGLTQMIGMRYGTVPVVRKTGGLADTVLDVDNSSNKEASNGYVFDGIHEGALDSALDRALLHYIEKPGEWNALIKKVMKIDNSWYKSAGEYVDLYNSVKVK